MFLQIKRELSLPTNRSVANGLVKPSRHCGVKKSAQRVTERRVVQPLSYLPC